MATPMKITGTRTQLVELPADEPLAGAAENPNGKRPIVTLRVETDGGIEGIGVAYFGGALTRTLAHAIDELGALCVGEDPVRVEAITQKPEGGMAQAIPPSCKLRWNALRIPPSGFYVISNLTYTNPGPTASY
jgi:L-alanine-DL-glutamate epimerase-like enolase superfamily enzyme